MNNNNCEQALKYLETITFNKSKKEIEKLNEIIFDKILITQFTPELKAKIELLKNLQILCINSCQFNSFENFPDLPQLQRVSIYLSQFPQLELINNSLEVQQLFNFPVLPSLISLNISKNYFEPKSCLLPLSQRANNLKQLDVFYSLTNDSEIRLKNKVFDLFPRLKIFNNLGKDSNEFQLSQNLICGMQLKDKLRVYDVDCQEELIDSNNSSKEININTQNFIALTYKSE